jgi:hypothetical protein
MNTYINIWLQHNTFYVKQDYKKTIEWFVKYKIHTCFRHQPLINEQMFAKQTLETPV